MRISIRGCDFCLILLIKIQTIILSFKNQYFFYISNFFFNKKKDVILLKTKCSIINVKFTNNIGRICAILKIVFLNDSPTAL